MLWLYYLGLFPVALLLGLWLYELQRGRRVRDPLHVTGKTILLVDDDPKICELPVGNWNGMGFRFWRPEMPRRP